MSTAVALASSTIEVVAFQIGDGLAAVEIDQVQEINRLLDVIAVPHAPPHVRGVVNLRGSVVTVLDMRTLLGGAPGPRTPQCRNVVVKSRGELLGLWVDRIADIQRINLADLDPPPSNTATDRRLVRGVFASGAHLVMLLNLEPILAD
jgi:purine-binding chemotaxis protein CheW